MNGRVQMKNKKIMLAAVSLFSVFALAACSNSSKDLVTMKGGSITQEEFYQDIKASDSSKQTLQNAIIFKVAMNGYGDKVTDKAIDKEFEATKERVGGNFKDALKQANLTEAKLKEQIKQSLAFEAMIKSHIKVTDADIKKAWETFHPEVEAQIIKAESAESAEAILKEIKDGGDFSKIAKEKSIDEATKADGGTVKFDSTNKTIPAEVQAAAFKLEDNAVSDVLTVTSSNGYTQEESFYIVKMVKNQPKGNDLKPFEKELKKIVEDTKAADTTFQQEVIGKELQKAKITIEDDQLKSVIAQFLPEDKKEEETKESESKTKESEKKDSSTESSEAKSESSTEESSK